jgi:hypothetical protein
MDTLNTRIFPPRHFPKNFLRASFAETNAIIIRNKVHPFDYLDYTLCNLQQNIFILTMDKIRALFPQQNKANILNF